MTTSQLDIKTPSPQYSEWVFSLSTTKEIEGSSLKWETGFYSPHVPQPLVNGERFSPYFFH
jgi:hypothetical protein